MKKIKTDLKTTQKMLLELPHWVFIEKVDPEVNTLITYLLVPLNTSVTVLF